MSRRRHQVLTLADYAPAIQEARQRVAHCFRMTYFEPGWGGTLRSARLALAALLVAQEWQAQGLVIDRAQNDGAEMVLDPSA